MYNIATVTHTAENMDICRICLVSNTKLYDVENCILKTYEALTHCSLEDGSLRRLCWECRARLLACARFREKALRGQAALAALAPFDTHNVQKIKLIDRQAYNLVSSLTCTFLNQNDEDRCMWIDVEAQTAQLSSGTPSTDMQELWSVKVKQEMESDEEYTRSDAAQMSFNTECEIKQETTPEQNLKSDYHLGADSELTMETSESQAEMLRGHCNPKGLFNNAIMVKYFKKIEVKAHNSNKVLNYKEEKEQYTSPSVPVKYWYCTECDFKSIRKGALQVHQKTHTGEKPFQCELCEYSTGRKEVLKQHMLYKHTSEKAFKCSRCDYECHRRVRLEEHEKIHTGEKPFECDICGFRSISKMYLKTHKNKVHDVDLRRRRARKPTVPIKIKSDCDTVLSVKEMDNGVNGTGDRDLYPGHEVKRELALRLELEDLACDRVKPYKQPESTNQMLIEQSSEGNDAKTFQVDLRIKIEDTGFECDRCSNSYDTKVELEKHVLTHDTLEESIGSSVTCASKSLQSNHDGIYAYCTQCDYKTVKKSRLLIHERQHSRARTEHGLYGSKESGRHHISLRQENKACSNSFRDIKSLLSRKEKPLECKQCNYSCSTKTSLFIHERSVHDSKEHLVNDTNEKPFKCDNCDYTCKRKCQMAGHMKIHIRTKLKCGICGHGCSRNDLKYHLKKTHSIPPY